MPDYKRFCPQCGSSHIRKERPISVLVAYYRCRKCFCRCRYESFGAVRRLIAVAEGEMIVKRKIAGLKRTLQVLPAILALTYLVFGLQPWKAFAQADAGYTLVGTVAAPIVTYNDATVQNGLFYKYEVTAFNAVTETTPTADGVQSIPNAGTHTTTVSWIASVADATHTAPTGYRIYRTQVFAPNPPGVVSVTVN